MAKFFSLGISFGVGNIPQIHNLDAQVTYSLNSINSKIKIGGSNI